VIFHEPSEVFYPELDGADSGLVGTLGVRIISNADDSEAVARITSPMSEAPPGSGHYIAQITAPAVPGEYSIVWDSGVVSPGTVFTEELEVVEGRVPGLPGYPTVEALVSASGVTELTALPADAQDALRSSSIAAIEEFCGQAFDLEQGVVKHIDGQGANQLFLPRRLDALTAVLINGVNVLGAVALSDSRSRLHYTGMGVFGYYEQAMADVSGERFPTGFDNVTVSGDWGWPECPEPVAVALRFDMEDTARADTNQLSATVAAYRKLGIRDVSQGPLSVDVLGVPGLTPRVQQLLRPFIWQGEVGALA
jgi:hypothetical protein